MAVFLGHPSIEFLMRTLDKQDTYDPERVIKSLGAFDMWAVGITIVIGGQYFGWNSILPFGAGIGAMAACVITIGYICLVYCVAELSSGLPFAGKVLLNQHACPLDALFL